MKWMVNNVLIFIFMFSIVTASIEVYEFNMDSFYYPLEVISGESNISVVEGDYNSFLRSSDGEVVLLKTVLEILMMVYLKSRTIKL